MKGIVFTAFMEMVEARFGDEVLDRVLDESETEADGVYTAAGTYASADMISMVDTLGSILGLPTSALYEAFGQYLFFELKRAYPHFFQHTDDALVFMKNINDYIHVEVRKLYPDADLPHFAVEHFDGQKLVMVYQSKRRMSDLGVGLAKGCLEAFGQQASIHTEDLSGDGETVRFTMIKSEA